MTYPFKFKTNALGKFASYQILLNEFIESNPSATEDELHVACLEFANRCGLTVSEKAKRKEVQNNVD